MTSAEVAIVWPGLYLSTSIYFVLFPYSNPTVSKQLTSSAINLQYVISLIARMPSYTKQNFFDGNMPWMTYMSHFLGGLPHWVVSKSIDHGNSVILFFWAVPRTFWIFQRKIQEPGGWCQPLSGRFPPAEAKEVKPGTTCLPPNSGLSNDPIWNWTSKLRYNLLTWMTNGEGHGDSVGCSIDMPGDTNYTNRTTDLKDTREKKGS